MILQKTLETRYFTTEDAKLRRVKTRYNRCRAGVYLRPFPQGNLQEAVLHGSIVTLFGVPLRNSAYFVVQPFLATGFAGGYQI